MEIIDAQDSTTLDEKSISALFEMCKTLSKKFNLRQFNKTRVILVSDDYIRNLNKKFLGKDSPTNVLTFELGEENEVYVSVDTAKREFGDHQVLKGIAYYILHALLHLEGFCDSFDGEKTLMENLEQEIWKSLEKWNP